MTIKNNAAVFLERLNVGRYHNNAVNIESMITTNTDRYLDPLIRDKVHWVHVPYHRERVAAEDSIGNKLTWGFADAAWARYPKFYASDELGAPEIMQDARQLLQTLEFSNPATVAMALAAAHGWSLTYFWIDEQMKLCYEIFSENQCRPELIVRDPKTNQAIAWRIYLRPRLPLNRNQTNLKPIERIFWKGMPGLIHLTRGDEKTTFGFGLSRFEPTFDAITKLREESNANALRARVFPMAVVPTIWGPDQVKEFMKKISNMDQSTALVTKAAINPDGSMNEKLPAFSWITPATSSSSKSTQGGGVGMNDLSSEWARLCVATGHNLSYFVGSGAISSSMAAGQVDMYDDVQADIEEFNLYREYIKEFLMWIKDAVEGLEVEEYFMPKCHKEWERDEKILFDAAQTMQEESEEDNMAETQNQAIQDMLITAFRNNMSMPMLPTSSSTVKGIGLDEKKLLVQFHGGSGTYAYDFSDPEQGQKAFDEMVSSTSKGGYVWDKLRGKQMGQAWGSSGKQTMGGGSASLVPYEKQGRSSVPLLGGYEQFQEVSEALRKEKVESTGPVMAGQVPTKIGKKRAYYPDKSGPKFYDLPQAGYPKSPIDQGAAMQKTKAELATGKRGRPAKAQSYFEQRKTAMTDVRKMIQGIAKPKKNELIDLSPLRFNEMASVAGVASFGKGTIDKVKALLKYQEEHQNEDVFRINSMAVGNDMRFDVDLHYSDGQGGYLTERVCNKSYKKLIGTTGVLQVFHMNNKYPVGSITMTGWDETTDTPITELDYDPDLVWDALKKENKMDCRIAEKLKNNEVPAISTNYRCDVIHDKRTNTNFQINFRNWGAAFVEQGNCPDNLCVFDHKEV